MIRFIVSFSLVGLIIPIIFTMIWALLERSGSAYISMGNMLETAQIMLWPSSIFMAATAGHEGIDYGMLALSIIANGFLYLVFGLLIWLGIYKHRFVL